MLYKVRVPRCGVFGQTAPVRYWCRFTVVRGVLRELPQRETFAVAGARLAVRTHWARQPLASAALEPDAAPT